MAQDPICGMSVNEKTGFKLNWQGQDYYFCSGHCLKKFRQQNNIQETPQNCSSCSPNSKSNWWTSKILIISLIYIAIFSLSNFIQILMPLKKSLLMYMNVIAIPVLIGLLLGGIIDWLVPREYVSAILAQKKKRTIVYAVITGFLMSACSHGILALAIQLHKKGSSPPATVAFLLSSPWANLPLTIIMFGFFGIKALFIILSAIVIALITGYIFMFLESKNLIEHNPNTVEISKDFSIINDIKQRTRKIKLNVNTAFNGIKSIWEGSVSLANMVLWWIMLGALLASIAAAYMPVNFMHQYMGPTIAGLLITLFIATIIEICSEGSAPLAFEIFRQTGALGNSFAFLMAGVVTDYTEIGLIWTNIGWKTAVWLPIITVPQVIVLAMIANVFL